MSNATTPSTYGGVCVALVSPHSRRGAATADLLLGLPLLVFLAIAAARARSDVRRLTAARSRLLWGFYGGAWAAVGLCVARLALLNASARASAAAAAAAQSGPWPPRAPGLDAAWLLVQGGVTAAEVAAVAFLAAGHLTPTPAALLKTGAAAGVVAGVEVAAEAALVFRGGVPLFRWAGGKTAPTANGTAPANSSSSATRGDLARPKWAWHTARSGLAAGAYAALAALPGTRLRAVLPARPAFYRYAFQMAVLHGAAAAGAALLWMGARRVGYCTSAVASMGLGGFWPLLFAAAFLGEFLFDGGLDEAALYYSEMRDAGYFAGDGAGEDEEETWF